MMKLVSTVIVIVLVGLIVWAVRAKPEKEVVAAILAAAAAVSAAIVGTGLTQQAAKERELADAHRLHKVELYTEYTDLIVKGFSLAKSAEDATPEEKAAQQEEIAKEFQDGFLNFSKKLLLWGSPEVLRAYERFRLFGQDPANTGDARILLYSDDVFRAMRSDLGLDNRGLRRGELVKLFISNAEEVDRLVRQSAR